MWFKNNVKETGLPDLVASSSNKMNCIIWNIKVEAHRKTFVYFIDSHRVPITVPAGSETFKWN